MNSTQESTFGNEVDLYREVHKGLRLALFELVHAAGTIDASDANTVDLLAALFSDVDMMLQTHHTHEEGAELGELIALHASAAEPALTEAHEWSDAKLAVMRSLVADLQAGKDTAVAIYDETVTFTAGYLDHMQIEENQVMPALQASVPAGELMAIEMTIRGSVPPADMCVFLRYMLPAMTPDERTATLGGMKAGAPTEIFQLFWGVAEKSLTSSDLETVSNRLAA